MKTCTKFHTLHRQNLNSKLSTYDDQNDDDDNDDDDDDDGGDDDDDAGNYDDNDNNCPIAIALDYLLLLHNHNIKNITTKTTTKIRPIIYSEYDDDRDEA